MDHEIPTLLKKKEKNNAKKTKNKNRFKGEREQTK